MKSHPFHFRIPGLVCLVFALNCHPFDLRAQDRPRAVTRDAARAANETVPAGRPVRYDIEIVEGHLLLANLKGRINPNAKWGAGSSDNVEATLGNVVEVLRDLHTNANIVVQPGTENVRIQNLKLRSVELDHELEALRIASGNTFIWSVNEPLAMPNGINPATGMPSSPIRLFTIGSEPQGYPERSVEVFNLSGYFQQFGERDKKEMEESLSQIQNMILHTLDKLNPVDAADKPSFQFHPGANLLIVIGQRTSLDVARKVITALPGAGGVVPPWAGGGFDPGTANPFGASKSHRALMGKLESIRIDSISIDGMPLGEVVRVIGEEAKKRDPDKQGINILVKPAPDLDMNAVTIKIVPALKNLRLTDVLDAIVRVADHPITYSVTDYAVVFSLDASGGMTPPLPPGYAPR